MVEIEFSVMAGSQADANRLLPILEAFENEFHIHVNLIGLLWENGWTEIVKYGIYGHGPDISSIGTSWIGSMAAMRALRPFKPQQIRELGGEEAFFKACWRTGFLPNDESLYAVPWLGDTYVLYYWKEALDRAGIQDPERAFADSAALVDTLEKLSKSGYPSPLALCTAHNPQILHQAVHWVWNAGGDIISPDNRKVIFNQPAALEGFRNYFELLPYVPHEGLNAFQAERWFTEGKAALFIGNTFPHSFGLELNSEWGKRLGIALLPGTSYVGGCSLVVWDYSIHDREAFELVHYLTSQPLRMPASPHEVYIPTRRKAMEMPSIKTDIFHRTYLQALQTGRSYPTIRLWGSIEEKLIAGLSNIWEELFTQPDTNLDGCLHKHLDPLAQRLNSAIEN